MVIYRETCEDCQYKEWFPEKLESRATNTPERIHSNLMDLLQHQSFGRSKYILIFTDDYS
jgi:hypothetical protein